MFLNAIAASLLSLALSPAVSAFPVPQQVSGGIGPWGFSLGPNGACGSAPGGFSGCIGPQKTCGSAPFGSICFGQPASSGGWNYGPSNSGPANYGPSNYGPNYGPSSYGPSNYGPSNYGPSNYGNNRPNGWKKTVEGSEGIEESETAEGTTATSEKGATETPELEMSKTAEKKEN